MSQNAPIGRHSIAAVSKLTGIGSHALRVWERRYGFPVPHRIPSGHRRYTQGQVEALAAIARGLKLGRPLRELMAEVQGGKVAIAAEGEAPEEPAKPAFFAAVDRIQEGDIDGAESAYRVAASGLRPLECAGSVILPALIEIGERWFRGEYEIFQEHAATGFFRNKLMVLVDQARAANPAPRRSALIGTVQGDRHEGGVLLLNLALELQGWRGLVLGTDLPVREYQKAIDQWHPDAVCLSFVLSRNVNKRFDELAKLHGAPVYVGGRSLVNYQGLARRRGLHPLVGSCEEAVRRLIAEVESCGSAEAT